MKIIGTFILAIGVFAAAAAGSWWMQHQQLKSSSGDVAESMEEGNPSFIENESQIMNPAEEDFSARQSSGSDQVSVEELVRLGMDLKAREKRLAEEQEKLRQQEIQQQIVFAEVQKEMEKVSELRSVVRTELGTGENLVQRLLQARQAMIEEKNSAEEKLNQVQEAMHEVDGYQQENTKKLAQWIQSMDESKAAEVLREMANDGKMTVAVEILSHLEEREAAQILSEFNDAKLVQDMVTEFRNLKAPQESRRDRRSVR